jgi:glycerophosphoryl diester phosphodiesterase
MTVREAIRRAWALRRPFLTLHLAAAVVGAAVLGPLVAATARLAASLSGAPAVADFEIAGLLLSPLGFVGGLLLASVVITAAVVEVAAMLVVDAAARAGRAVSALGALRAVAHRLPAVLLLAAMVVLRVLARVLPVAGLLWLAQRWLIGAHDINFYLSTRPPEFIAFAVLAGGLGLALAVVLAERLAAWGLSLPAAVLGGLGARAALAESLALTQGLRWRLAAQAAVWVVAALALGAGLSALATAAVRLAAPGAGASLDRLALHVALALALLAAANLLAAAAAAGSLAALVGGHYAAAGGAVRPLGREAAEAPRRLPVALLALAALVAAGFGTAKLTRGMMREAPVAVIAHRGAAAVAPENTLPAVEQAIAEGADWIEIDVQETADGAVVVVHDADFMKLAGVPVRVADATLAEIEAIDVGAAFAPAFAGTRVPTLAAVLAAAKGRAKVLIELKHHGRAVRLEERVAEAVEAAGMAGEIAVMSLDHASARRMKALRPDWSMGLLAASALGDLVRLDADFLAVATRLATPALIGRAQAVERPLYVWTVNDRLVMSQMISRGVSGLITDRPGLAVEVLAERAEMTAAERLSLLAADLFGLRTGPGTGGRDASP